MGRWSLVAGLVAALGVASGVAAAPVLSPSGIDPRLTLEWEPGQDRCGRPVLSGYVHNSYDRTAYQVRVLVETLDESGRPIDRQGGFVVGVVPVRNRSYFEVRLNTTGPNYRVTITTFDWRDGGGGGA
jgi:hypothetical protein